MFAQQPFKVGEGIDRQPPQLDAMPAQSGSVAKFEQPGGQRIEVDGDDAAVTPQEFAAQAPARARSQHQQIAAIGRPALQPAVKLLQVSRPAVVMTPRADMPDQSAAGQQQ